MIWVGFWIGVLYLSGLLFSCIYGRQFVEESWAETSEEPSPWDPLMVSVITLALSLIWPYWVYSYLKRGRYARS